MKRFLLALTILSFSVATNAQIKEYRSDTLTNVDTSILSYLSTPSHLKSIEVDVIKISGTVAGKVYLQGADNLGWENLDSLVLADQAAVQWKTTKFTSTSYSSYRTKCITTGTQSFGVYVTMVRRSDE